MHPSPVAQLSQSPSRAFSTKEAHCYVLDVNVLLHDPQAPLAFSTAEVVIPISVIEEIDQFKTQPSETGRNARLVASFLDQLAESGPLTEGVVLSNKGHLRVHVNAKDIQQLPAFLDARRSSNRTLACALNLQQLGAGKVVVVSQDANTRIKANALGVSALGYEGGMQSQESLLTGWRSAMLADAPYQKVQQAKQPPKSLDLQNMAANEGIIVHPQSQPKEIWCAWRCRGSAQKWMPVRPLPEGVWGMKPRNPQQALALDLLLDPDISVVTLVGKAGTGKTLLALAAGLQCVLDENRYACMLVSRPVFPMGKDIGFLPGTAQEKLEPWMQPIFDNLSLLVANPLSPQNSVKGWETLVDQGMITIEPLTYIRGRSISQQFMVVDEAQNLTPHEMKTILTRVGEGTKIVLTGDPQQIDHPYLDGVSNGLTHVVERMKTHVIAGHVTLMHGERSALAELAANIL